MSILINIDSENEMYTRRLATKIKSNLMCASKADIDIHEVIGEEEYEDMRNNRAFEYSILHKHEENIDKVKELTKKRDVIINTWTTNSLYIHEGEIIKRLIFRLIKRRLVNINGMEVNIFIYSNRKCSNEGYMVRGENVIRNPYKSIKTVSEFIKEHCFKCSSANKITILIDSDLINEQFHPVSDDRITQITRYIRKIYDFYSGYTNMRSFRRHIKMQLMNIYKKQLDYIY